MSTTLKFFVGKGGVGKSTVSALAALSLAGKGRRVLLVSMDPAHNQSDIFQEQFSEKPRQVTEHLSVIEIDVQRWIREYLKRIETEMARNYSYLTGMNLDKYFKLLRHSPGLEEYALTLAFHSLLKKHENIDTLIFDMPPTALAMRFFIAPSLSLLWVEQLEKLRETIIEKKEMATKIKFGSAEFERDKVLNKLREDSRGYRNTMKIFRDADKTQVHVVLNPDELSWKETERIVEQFETLGMGISSLIVNKTIPVADTTAANTPDTAAIGDKQAGYTRVNVPFASVRLIGRKNLLNFLRKHPLSLPD